MIIEKTYTNACKGRFKKKKADRGGGGELKKKGHTGMEVGVKEPQQLVIVA